MSLHMYFVNVLKHMVNIQVHNLTNHFYIKLKLINLALLVYCSPAILELGNRRSFVRAFRQRLLISCSSLLQRCLHLSSEMS